MPAQETVPVLELRAAQPAEQPGEPREPALSLRADPGDLLLVEAREARQAALFADLCAGLVALGGGSAHFLGHDWTTLPQDIAASLRGRMGRVFGERGWIGFLDMEANILLGPLHHTRRDRALLRAEAAALARQFGLPGLPMGRPADHPPPDLRRAACVRAFLGEPMLLLLENPVADQDAELLPPLVAAIEAARDRGAAVIWLTRSAMVWGDRTLPATSRLRLLDRGLIAQRMAA